MAKYLSSGKDLLAHIANNMSSLITPVVFYVALMSSPAWAEDNSNSHYLENYNLSALEYCEFYMSSLHALHPEVGSDQYVKCKNMNLFKPLRTLEFPTFLDGAEPSAHNISLSKPKDDDWPLVDLSIKTSVGKWRFHSPKMKLNGYDYILSEYLMENPYGYRKIEVGHSGETIIIRFHSKTITQLVINPTYCEGGDIRYTVNQILSWYPAFLEDSFQKTFLKSPTCI